MKKLILFILLISCPLFTLKCEAQDQQLVDSLQLQLKNHNARKLELGINAPAMYDTIAANILYQLAKANLASNPDKAMEYAMQSLSLSEQIGFKKGTGKAYNIMGAINSGKGNYMEALDLYGKTLEIRIEIDDKKGIASGYNNIGVIYDNIGKYPEALKNYFASLKIQEEIGDKYGVASSYNNIGIIYDSQDNYPEALKNYFIALKLRNEIGDRAEIAASYVNIGVVYKKQANYPDALKNQLAALKIFQEIGDKSGIASSYNNIGNIYARQGNYPGATIKVKTLSLNQALKNILAALEIEEEIGDKNGIVNSYINIGNIYATQQKFDEAYRYLNKALALSKEIGSLDQIKYSYEGLAIADSGFATSPSASVQKRIEYALQGTNHYKLFIAYRDSLVNKENTKKITQQQMQYDFDKKESLTKAEQEKKDAIAKKEVQKQKLVRNAFIGGTILFLLLAGAIFMGLTKTSKEKKKSEELLLNILPPEVASELKLKGFCKPKTFNMVTVMFADFKDFTSVSERVSAELLVGELNYCFSGFDNILKKYKIEKIKTVGDAYLCASGLPSYNNTHAFDVVTAALEMKAFILNRINEKKGLKEIAFQVRIGINTGPVVAGIVGVRKFSYDIWGDTVNIAARMEECCEPGNVNISGSTYQLVKDLPAGQAGKFACTYRGKIQAKHKGEIDMYFVEQIL